MPSSPSSSTGPSLQALTERYGTLFGSIISEQWDRGGRDVHEAVAGIQAVAQQEEEEAEADGEGDGEAEGDDAEGEEDEEDEEARSAMEE